MILRQLGSNQTELSLNNGNSIFFSYETPVAGFDSEDGFFKTETYYSKTTSRHINQYFKHVDASDIAIVTDNYIVDRVKTMIVLREQDKWMRERAQKLSMRDWHVAYEEESKKIIPEIWDEKGNDDDTN